MNSYIAGNETNQSYGNKPIFQFSISPISPIVHVGGSVEDHYKIHINNIKQIPTWLSYPGQKLLLMYDDKGFFPSSSSIGIA
jgi:hypothetical protein